jgi:hypothetical protein
MEMLALDVSTNLFISATAHQGANLLLATRDDSYLSELLHFIGVFWACVRDGASPPPDIHWRREPERYGVFLDATVALGKAARLERHLARPWRREAVGATGRLFLEEAAPPEHFAPSDEASYHRMARRVSGAM